MVSKSAATAAHNHQVRLSRHRIVHRQAFGASPTAPFVGFFAATGVRAAAAPAETAAVLVGALVGGCSAHRAKFEPWKGFTARSSAASSSAATYRTAVTD
jgi:hypothetical protein